MTTSNDQPRSAFTSEIVYQKPYSGEIVRDIVYGADDSLLMDVYYPEARQELLPAVILVTGFPDPGYQQKMGMKQREVMWYVSWAKLLAASGIIAITYTNTDPGKDVSSLFAYLREQGTGLGIDSDALGIMSMSANASNALAVLLREPSVQCGALLYGYTMDLGDSTYVADAQKVFGFSMPDRDMDGFPDTVPLLIARAGNEENPGLNESIDLFVEEASKRDAPVSVLHYEEGSHCFDILDESLDSIAAVKKILQFMQSNLLG